MLKILHPVAGAVAMLTIATFWLSTLGVELFAGREAVIAVKTTIPWGFLLLIPALAATGLSGASRAKFSRGALLAAKMRRMKLIAANGLLILLPSAFFLAARAGGQDFDRAFYAVQALELTAGALNLTLLALNFRDGLRLIGKIS